jgi:phosphonate transport system permease protein
LAAGIALLVVASFASLKLQWAALFSAESGSAMAAFALSFFPPEHSPAFLWKTLNGTLETIAMSLLGTGLACVFGLLLALPASQFRPGDSAGQEGGARWSLIGGRLLRLASRSLLNGLRSIPELVWASLLLIAAGLGPFPGTLALALHTTGVLGRLFAESIENANPGPASALEVRGVRGWAVFLYATLPQVSPQLLSYALYRWENNIRAAAVLGVVGAGGLGQMLYVHLSLFQMHETCTVLIAMLGLVAAVDAASALARRRLNR